MPVEISLRGSIFFSDAQKQHAQTATVTMAELNNPPNHHHSRYSNIDPILYDQLEGLGVLSMKEAFGKSPYDFQKELITHLLSMACPRVSRNFECSTIS